MSENDYIGQRGEILFLSFITDWCDGAQWFEGKFLGEKNETADYAVKLVEPTSGDAFFFVQVKAAKGAYRGKGKNRKLRVNVTKEDMAKLKQSGGPAFVFGIDIVAKKGYFMQVSKKSPNSLSGMPLKHRINCKSIKKIWESVNQYWTDKNMLPDASPFDLKN